MPGLSQDAIRELRQSLPLLERLEETFGSNVELSGDEFLQLERALHRVQSLTDYSQFRSWVGDAIERPTKNGWYSSSVYKVKTYHRATAKRLYLYTQGIVENKKLEEMLDRLTQENASLREQLAELRQREFTYLSNIREAQTSTTYSLPPKDKEILLDSLQRQKATLTKNLCWLQEKKAQYGPLNVPLDILNAIDQTQEELRPIDDTIGYLGANITEMK